MRILIVAKPTVRDGHLLIQLNEGQLQALQSHSKLDIQIKAHDSSIGAEHNRYYYGVFIPHIQRAYKELNGVQLSEGEIDLLCKKEANNGKFRTVEVNSGTAILFDEISLSTMKRSEFMPFIDNCIVYWNSRGIDPVKPKDV